MSQCIVICGMHRTGSSLVAKIYHEWGVNLGKNLMEPDGANPDGFYENWDFVIFNDHLLNKTGGSWNYPLLITEPHDAAQDVIVKNKSELWGWKDNRTCFTFKAYEPFLENVMFVICKRNKESVIKSLFRTHHKLFDVKDRTEEYFGQLYDKHYAALDIVTKGYPTVTVNYEDLENSKFFNKESKHF